MTSFEAGFVKYARECGLSDEKAAHIFKRAMEHPGAQHMFKDLSEAAKQVYTTLNCRGVVRIDFIYNENAKKAFLLEVNTVPGQSEASIIPQQVRAMGWNLTDFYATIIEDSLASR